MTPSKDGISVDQPIEYQIEIQGRLDASWSHWFDDMKITTKREAGHPTVTILRGIVVDQAALHGLLNRIRDLGLPLLSVQMMNSN
jgi:hypothetical protein